MTSITALTAYTGGFKIIGWIAIVLGYIMEAMYNLLSAMGIHSLGIAIILFTFIIYTLLLPLTYKQQKFSKLTQKMNPELKAIQAKYKGKKDQASQQKMVEEQRELYDKYGVSPTGSCLQLAIQLPILYALYRVIYNIPAYVGKVYDIFTPAINGIMGVDGYQGKFDEIISNMSINLSIIRVSNPNLSTIEADIVPNRIVDILYKFSPDNWSTLIGSEAFSGIASTLTEVQANLSRITSFLLINISETPQNMVVSNWKTHHYGVVIMALLIPILSGLTQYIAVKLMPTTPQNVGGEADAMARQMKTMNYMMPVISIIFTFTLPAGMGIYWIAGAVIRTFYMILLNKHFDKIDLNTIIEKNKAKAAKKKEKRAAQMATMQQASSINTRSLSSKSNSAMNKEKEEALEKAAAARANAKPGSLSAKANMVKDFNERNMK